jgi:CheY-like chemotaxis protein
MSASSANDPAILLVDDNPHDVVLLRLAFRRVGIIDPIKLVKDGAEAMRYLKGEGIYADRHAYPTPTLMLLDLKMPQTSGFDVLRWVREQTDLKRLIVVVMTGSKQDDDVQRAYQLGADSYLVKPTKFSDLVEMTQCLKAYCSAAIQGTPKPDSSPLATLSLPPKPGQEITPEAPTLLTHCAVPG